MPRNTTSRCENTLAPWRRVVGLCVSPDDRALVARAFPRSAQATLAELGLEPAGGLRADEAARAAAGRDGGAVLLVTAFDLCHPDLPSLVGFADARRKAAVVSFARLRDAADDGVTVRRLRSVAAHEGGHVRGLGHCSDAGCVMHPVSGTAPLDARGDAPCVLCAGRGSGFRAWTRRLFAGAHG